MIDFGALRKFIYFPQAYERDRAPYVIHVLERWGDSWKGNRNAQELLAGRFSHYALRRCQPYSDELWQACEDWNRRRVALAEEYERMMKKGAGKL